MRCHRQLGFTLIELMIAVLLITMAGVMIGFQVDKAMRQERFYGSVRRIVERLQMGQDLMLTSGGSKSGMDTRLTFHEEQGEWSCRIAFDRTLPERSLYVNQEWIPLPGVARVSYEAANSEDPSNLTLGFRSIGSKVPRGILTIASTSNVDQTRYIRFPGYPQAIKSVKNQSEMPSKRDLEELSGELFPTELFTSS
jgi:prepilin-type N-terminal cleavage/methylation domain-containing protein